MLIDRPQIATTGQAEKASNFVRPRDEVRPGEYPVCSQQFGPHLFLVARIIFTAKWNITFSTLTIYTIKRHGLSLEMNHLIDPAFSNRCTFTWHFFSNWQPSFLY